MQASIANVISANLLISNQFLQYKKNSHGVISKTPQGI